MSRKNRVGQIIKAFVAVGTLIALACRFGVIKATLDNLRGLTSWAHDALWPTQLADGLITLPIIDQLRDIDLQGRTPVMGLEHGMAPVYPILTSTTLESNMSQSDKLSDPRPVLSKKLASSYPLARRSYDSGV